MTCPPPALVRAVDDRRAALVSLSHRVPAYAELTCAERRTAAWLAKILAECGFAVDQFRRAA